METMSQSAITDRTHWPVPGGHRFTLEATGYALMALVKAKEFDQAGHVVKWLTEQRFHNGRYDSTQATIIVFQAVAQYMMEVPDLKDVDLHVSINISGRSQPLKWTFNNENAYVTRSAKVVTLYHALPEEKETDCKKFDLQVKIEEESEDRDAAMSVLDITMLTGFTADKKDLARVSHKLSDRVVFRIHKITRVGLLQPAAVTLYEYYAMENRCMKFYHPEKKDGALNRICHEEVCRCAEENCSYQRKKRANNWDRLNSACEAGMDYVYKATVVHADLTPALDHFTIRVDEVIKEGTDTGVGGKERIFMAHPYCREAIDLSEGSTYLIMGKFKDLVEGKDRLLYMLGGGTWIEYWPTEAECQEPAYNEACKGITSAAEELQTFGCRT
ncbi:hypothetical protein MATL_G00002910 [Megalops atlanticus]|uniref:NTR domain-containing protein n=1 Tax=Megalops atlanticus TaxID=7932 RepID=A0A9D3TJ27_MEGAT|nr:hypothetical protein MATL_G00002910 [Megalops atlanticus]